MLWIRKYINQTPSFNNFETHISTIEKTVETNPALCIEIKISNTTTMGNFKLW